MYTQASYHLKQLKYRLWQAVRPTQLKVILQAVSWVEICETTYCETLISLFVHWIISIITRQIPIGHFPVRYFLFHHFLVLQFPPLRFFRHFPVLQIPVTLNKEFAWWCGAWLALWNKVQVICMKLYMVQLMPLPHTIAFLHLNPELFNLSGAGLDLPRLSWKDVVKRTSVINYN